MQYRIVYSHSLSLISCTCICIHPRTHAQQLTLFLMVVTRLPLETASMQAAPLAPHPAELAILCILLFVNLTAWAASSIGVS